MAKVIQIADKLSPIDLNTEPCSKCPEETSFVCKETCPKATIWWHIFAKQFGEKANG